MCTASTRNRTISQCSWHHDHHSSAHCDSLTCHRVELDTFVCTTSTSSPHATTRNRPPIHGTLPSCCLHRLEIASHLISSFCLFFPLSCSKASSKRSCSFRRLYPKTTTNSRGMCRDRQKASSTGSLLITRPDQTRNVQSCQNPHCSTGDRPFL